MTYAFQLQDKVRAYKLYTSTEVPLVQHLRHAFPSPFLSLILYALNSKVKLAGRFVSVARLGDLLATGRRLGGD
jgi:hypothetical protein